VEISLTSIILLSLSPIGIVIVTLALLDALGVKEDRKSIAIFGVVLLFAVTLGTPIFFDFIDGVLNLAKGENLSLVVFSMNRVIFVTVLSVVAIRVGTLIIEFPLRWYLGKIESDWVSSIRILTAILLFTLSFDLFGTFISAELNPTSILHSFGG